MCNTCYVILGKIFFNIMPELKINGNWEKFRYLKKEKLTASIDIYCRKSIMFTGVEIVPTYQADYLLKNGTDSMLVNKGWEKGWAIQIEREESLDLFLLQMFYAQAVKQNMILLHSSLIDWKGRGLMFLGPSGIGKTTQAELWNQYRDALIINGDAVFVQETPDAFLGWGTPWHGSSPYCENTSVPVAAMVVLKQAPKNSIRELTGFEKVTEVSNSVFYPQWVEGGMELCLETLDHLLTKIPVYELSCRPDEGAVELVEQVVFGHVQ